MWYTDESLADYLQSVALSYQQDTGIKVDIVLKDGVSYLEEINEASLAEGPDRKEAFPDLYITSHDTLLRAYLSGLASVVTDPDGVIVPSMFPETAINAVTCYDHPVAYPLYYETNFFLYNKTYMASIAQNKIEADADIEMAEQATEELGENGAPKEEAKEIETDGDAPDEIADGENAEARKGEYVRPTLPQR